MAIPTLRHATLVTILVLNAVSSRVSEAGQRASRPEHLVAVDVRGLTEQRFTGEFEVCGGYGPDMPLGCTFTAGLTATVGRHPRSEHPDAARTHAGFEGFVRLRIPDLTGWSLGLRTGLYADRNGIRPLVGVETGVSWLVARRLYAGASVGARKVFYRDEATTPRLSPVVRVNLGIAY
ncbi:MAG: hypothetical protein IT181_15230 [Acidobacteria bacterium]|nr:hypothetical protein [Acidobacteriota bacterium]